MMDESWRLVRWAVHVTACGLLVIAVLAMLGEDRVAEAAGGLALGLVYALGPAIRWPWVRGAWLVAVTDGWMALAVAAPPFVWLALPLLFAYLDLLPMWLAMFGVAVLTSAAVLAAAWHAGGASVPLVAGPGAGAVVMALLALARKPPPAAGPGDGTAEPAVEG